MKEAKRILLFLLLLPFMPADAHNTDSTCNRHCGCGQAIVPPGIMLGHVHNKTEWMISYRYMQMQMNGLYNGTQTIAPETVFATYLMAPDRMRMHMHMLMVMYGITDRVTLMGMGNYNFSSMNMTMFAEGGHHHGSSSTGSNGHTMRSSGWSDTRLQVLVALVKQANQQFMVSGGIGLPTGSVTLKGPAGDLLYAGKNLPYDMQLGSGTFDLLPGIAYARQHNQVSLGVQASGIVRTGTNAAGYRWGNEAAVNAWVACRWWGLVGASARAEGVWTGHMQGSDAGLYRYNEPAANVYNHGGQRINVHAGLYIKPQNGAMGRFMLAVEYGLPLYQNLNGIQMPATHLINTALNLTF